MIRFLALPLLCTVPLVAAAPQEPVDAAVPAEPEALELDGTLIPLASEAVEIWPETWSGELLFLEVVPHGTRVADGQVIARFDTRAIDEQIRAAEEDLQSAMLNFEISVRKAELEERAAVERIELAERGLKRSKLDWESFHEFDLPMRSKQMELQKLYAEDGIADQKDELAQLQAMYEDDEIVDATEDIVMKRSVRQLERTLQSMELSQKQREHNRAHDWKLEAERKEEDLHRQTSALEKMIEEHELDQRARHDRLQRSERELKRKEEKLAKLTHDREFFELRAPRAGMLLHGGVDDYRPGAAAPRHERGGRGQLRAAMFSVADPHGFRVAVKLKESQISGLAQGAAVSVKPVILTEGELAGTLTVEAFPLPESARGPENEYAGVVELDNRHTGWAPGMRAKVVVE